MKYFSLISFLICHHNDKAKLLLYSFIMGTLGTTVGNFNQLLSMNIVIIIIISSIITGAQPKAGTALKMQTVRLFSVKLLRIYR